MPAGPWRVFQFMSDASSSHVEKVPGGADELFLPPPDLVDMCRSELRPGIRYHPGQQTRYRHSRDMNYTIHPCMGRRIPIRDIKHCIDRWCPGTGREAPDRRFRCVQYTKASPRGML